MSRKKRKRISNILEAKIVLLLGNLIERLEFPLPLGRGSSLYKMLSKCVSTICFATRCVLRTAPSIYPGYCSAVSEPAR